MDVDGTTICCEVLRAICQRHLVVCMNEHCSGTVIAESLAVDASSVPDSFGQGVLPSVTPADWRKAQADDPHISRVVSLLAKAAKPSDTGDSPEHAEVKLLLRQWCKLELRDGMLYRRWVNHDRPVYQLVLTKQFRQIALQGVHDEVGHLGAERALHLARARFFWPGMAKDIERNARGVNAASEGKLSLKMLHLWRASQRHTHWSSSVWTTCL